MTSDVDPGSSASPPPLPTHAPARAEQPDVESPTSSTSSTSSAPHQRHAEQDSEFVLDSATHPFSSATNRRREHDAKRIAPTLVVLFGVIPFAGLVAAIVLAIVGLADQSIRSGVAPDIEKLMRDLAESPNALWYLVVPGQLAFLAAAVVPAMLSPTPLRERLGLVSPRLDASTWLLVLAGQVGILLVVTTLLGWISPEPSEAQKSLGRMVASASGSRAWIAYLVIAVLPGVGEELLFRGYAQSRLERAWPAGRAILLPSLIFTLAHWDPQHMAGVLPIAFYLGFVRWATGSTWVTIACHIVNNAIGIALGDGLGADGSTLATVSYLVAVTLFALCTILAISELRRARRVRSALVVG